MESELEVGCLYYRFGFQDRDGKEVFVVSTWVYQGVVRTRCTTDQCDVPFHYYEFVEFESLLSHKSNPDFDLNKCLIPSIAQVEISMQNFSELREEVIGWRG